MKKVTKEFEVYSLDEVREKALEMNRFINIGDYAWWESIFENWEFELAEKGFKNASIKFSGFYSQGDGACFDCDDFDMKKLLELVSLSEDKKDLISRMINDDSFFLKMYHANSSNLYCHERTRFLDWGTEIDNPAFYTTSTISKTIDEFVLKLEEERIRLCKEIYSDLYNGYKDLISDEAVEDTLLVNEYEFNADGTIF